MMRVYAVSIGDLVNLARERLSRGFTDEECEQFHIEPCPAAHLPVPSTKPAPGNEPVGGPSGAFRVEVTRRDLLDAGFPEGLVSEFDGDYTWSLLAGRYRIHRVGTDDAWENTGTYEVTGDRMVFTDLGSDCFGMSWSIRWSLRSSLSFADPTPAVDADEPCADATDAWVRAVFVAEPWAWVMGASAIG